MKKSLTILTVIMFIITIFQINSTYAKFFAEASAKKSMDVGKWIIKVNDLDIYNKDGETVKFTVKNLNYGTSVHTNENTIAPGRKGYFDIKIDPKGTDVAVRYDITYDLGELNKLKEQNSKILFSVEENTRKNTIVKTGENTYTGIINLADIKREKTDTVRFELTWENSEENSNEDTKVMLSTKEINIPINVTVTQYLGEEIIQYKEK